MSNISGASSGSSNAHSRGRCFGVPKICWCGEAIVELISKSDSNPYRRYYRCSFASRNKLRNDNHIFKWVEEALFNEIQKLDSSILRIEQQQQQQEKTTTCLEFEKTVFKKVKMKIEKEMFEKVEDVLIEAKADMKQKMILLIVCCLLIVVCMKLL